ncbi:MAG TPA: SGNH/GDSL hydrolase family protein [Flavisolibacter sp.]|nr:SGNH/GDSL hydrolase family protein [Flavisolibacter sp.]
MLEVILRIYNPFHFRLKNDRIILPVKQQMLISNTINDKLDSNIINTRNSIGFRGPEKPEDFEEHLSIITVGGSTTECHFLSDGKTWPDKLRENLNKRFKKLWLNNAGFDGHSTFGHQVLLNDYLIQIKPKVILFFVGINDVENDQPSFHDKLNIKGAYPDFKHFIFTNSEVLSLGLNLVRGWRAQKFNNTTHSQINLKNYTVLELPEPEAKSRLASQTMYLRRFEKRLTELIDTCIRYNILPVFMTQPNLTGLGKDSVTGADLEKIDVGDQLNGKLAWQMLEMYNAVTKNICSKRNVPVIDLAHLMPKSSRYYYDVYHYTNEGAEKVASIISPALTRILSNAFPQYYYDEQVRSTNK